jgi:rhodanese-related sulfurtransferase
VNRFSRFHWLSPWRSSTSLYMGQRGNAGEGERLFYNSPLSLRGPPVQFFIDNVFLIAIAFISGGMLIWPLVRGRAGGPSLSTLQATQLINSRNAVIVDVRTPQEFATGSLPGARNVAVDKVDEKAIKKDKPLIVVCATGSRAGKAAAQLRARGYGEVYVLAGGIAAWREAGLPIRS